MWTSLPSPIKSHENKKSLGIVHESPKRSKPGLIEIPFATKDGKFNCRGKDLPWLNASKLKKGDVTFLLVSISPFKKSYNPFEFDNQRLIKGEAGRCKIISAARPIYFNKDLISDHQSYFLNHLYNNIQSRSLGGVMAAMSVGDTSKLSPVIDRSFRESGLYHLLVVSGYQVMFLFFFLRQIIFYFSPKSHKESGHALIVGHLVGFVLCIYFGALTGFESATERAILGMLIAELLILMGMKFSFNGIILYTALILSVIHPGIFLTPSFQLTFAALIGISISENASKNLLLQTVISTSSATASAGIMSYLWFGNLNLISLPMNLIFAPLFSVISTAGSLVGVISVSLTGSDFILSIAELGTEALVLAVGKLSKLGNQIPLYLNQIYGICCLSLVIILLFVSAKRNLINQYALKTMRRRGEFSIFERN